MINNALFTSRSDEWTTPLNVFKELDDEFHFDLDPASTDENALCENHYTLENSGLLKNWGGCCVFCNPPYSEVGKWAKKCYEESKRAKVVVMLIPARTDTRWFHEYVYGKAEIRFIKGRLRYSNAKYNSPFPSMIVIWRNNNDERR